MAYLFKNWKMIILSAVFLMVFTFAYKKGAYDQNQIWVIKHLAHISETAKNTLLSSEAARKKEQNYALSLARIDREGLDKIREMKNETANTITALKLDHIRLSVLVKNNQARDCTTQTSSGLDYGEARAELSDEAFKFLAGEAERADKIVVQLQACQKVISLG